MSKLNSSINVAVSLAAIVIVGIAGFFLWNQTSDQVDFRIENVESLVASQPGTVQSVSINITNATASKARVVGTNAC